MKPTSPARAVYAVISVLWALFLLLASRNTGRSSTATAPKDSTEE